MKQYLKKVKEIEKDLLELIDEVAESVKEAIDENKLLDDAVTKIQLYTTLANVQVQLEQLQELG
jgi:hypothetical protein